MALTRATPTLRALVALTLGLLPLRLYAALRLGYGDSEALYACYALRPQAAYRDHPGLIGVLGRALSETSAPAPLRIHLATTLALSALPFLATACAKACGAKPERAPVAGLALVAAPEICVGLFGWTPDLPLAFAWLAVLGLFGGILRRGPDAPGANAAFLGLGLALGLAITAKASGALLPLALALTLASPAQRPWLRRPGPWLALAVCALVAAPVVLHEARQGFPMLRHRFVDTQARAGLSWRNLGAFLGGQLGYVSPPLLVGALLAARSLRARVARGPAAPHGPADPADPAGRSLHDATDPADPAGRSLHGATNPADPAGRSLPDATNPVDPVDRWLHDATIVPALALGALCLWSRVAEPHWFAPAWLALPLAEARAPAVGRRLARAALATGLALSLFVHAWVLTDLAPRWLGRFYVPRYDLANDMLAWPRAMPALRNALARWRYDELSPPAVLTPHWTLGAQVFANVGPDGAVGTLGGPDDFRDWLPAEAWHDRPWVLWVNDDRRPPARPAPLDAWTTLEHRAIVVERGGRPVRTVTIDVLGRPGAPPPARPGRPPP